MNGFFQYSLPVYNETNRRTSPYPLSSPGGFQEHG
jgi:hypothetical protein